MKIFKLVFVLLFFSTSLYAQELHLTILHDNDTHGNYLKNDNGEYGMAARKTLVDRIRKEVKSQGGEVLLLSAGDVNTGIPESDLLAAEPDFIGMNEIGYDAMALGNHEFDNPYSVLMKQKSLAKFPFLAANIYRKGTMNTPFMPFLKKNFKGVTITIVGLTTEDTGLFTKVREVEFKPSVQVGKDWALRLRKGSDILIALTHMGYYPNGDHKGEAPGDVSLARATNGMYDLIIGGHSQVPLFQPVNEKGTLIVQAHEWGKYLGRMDLVYKNKKLILKKYELIPVNYGNSPHNIPENRELLNKLEAYQRKVGSLLNQKIGELDSKFYGRPTGRQIGETNLGRLVAKSFCLATQSDLCFTNNGGLRNDLGPGQVSYRSILMVMPFNNDLCRVTLKPLEVIDMVKKIIDVSVDEPTHFFGGKIVMNKGKVSELSVMKNNRVLPIVKNGQLNRNSNESIVVGSSCYLLEGKSRYPDMKMKFGFVDTGMKDSAALKMLFEKEKLIRGETFKENNLIVTP